ncbi:MAG: peptidoglycan-binding domain-containing protein [Acidobacteriota bacterium]
MKKSFYLFVSMFAIFAILCGGVFAQDNNQEKKSPIANEKQLTKVRTEYQPATIEKAQQVLKGKGLYKGEVTGKMDADTRDAVKAFQQQQGLNPTGRLNKDTREKLGIEQVADGGDKKTKTTSKRSAKTRESAAGKDDSN